MEVSAFCNLAFHGRRIFSNSDGMGHLSSTTLYIWIIRNWYDYIIHIYGIIAKGALKMKKKALSPLVATLMLLVFAIAIGIIVMKWSEKYIHSIQIEESTQPSVEVQDNPLQILNIRYARGELSKEEYEDIRKTLIS